MAEQDEYVYRLGLDAREFVDGINQALTSLGNFDDRVTAKMPASLRNLSRNMAQALGDIDRAVGGKRELSLDDRKALAAEKRQMGQIQALQKEYKALSDAYARYQRESARGSGVPGGLNVSKADDATLARIRQVQTALNANGVSTPGPLGSAAGAEQARRTASAKADAAAAAAKIKAEQQATAAIAKEQAAQAAAAERAAARERAASEKAAADAVKAAEQTARANEAAAQKVARDYEAALPRVRYVLYDIANTAAVAGAATLGVGVSILKTAADYQSAYAQVKRTSDILTDPSLNQAQKDDRYAQLRSDLVGLSEVIPSTFQDLTQIAKTGNQLGIASTDIANFTETTAKFSAVTGVSVDTAATAFGRLGEILNEQDYKKVGDEIAYLGVRSVATEQDIISTASQLAVSGQGIRLTTEDVLALSTTVAGLGVKPEQARGTFVRAFSQIGSAVAAGGAQLNTLARLSGMSADDFSKAWSKGGDSAYRAFLDFTQGLGTSTSEVNANLASIGITAVRDRQTFGLLNQNGSRALKDLENASKGAKNGFLDTAFQTQAETVTSRLVTLGNTFKSVMDGLGQSTTGPVAGILGLAQNLLQIIQKITSSPFASWTSAIVVGLTVLAGVGLLAAAGIGRLFATIVAYRQVQALAVGGETSLAAVMGIVTGRAAAEAGALESVAAAQAAVGTTAEGAAAGQAALNASSAGTVGALGKAEGAGSKLVGVLGKAGMIGGIIALVASTPAFVTAIQSWADELTGATRSADDLEKKLESLKGKAAAQNLQDVKNALPGGKGTTLGDMIGSGFLNPLGLGDGKGGFNADNGRSYNGTQGAVNQITTGQRTPGTSISFFNGAAQFDKEADTQVAKIQTIDKALTALYSSGNKKGYQQGLQLYIASMEKQGVSAETAKAALISLTAAEKGAGDQAKQSGSDTAGFADDLSALFDANIQAQQVTSDLNALGAAVKDNGAQVAFSGSAMKTAITDIFASTDDASVAKGRLQSLYQQLLALGYAAPLLKPLSDAIDSIAGSARKAPIDISGFSAGLQDASKQARTLADYASDLGGVLDRTFTLRFGDQQAIDKVNSGWKDMASSIKDARDQLKAAKADLQSLQADQRVNQYQLDVATQFGDTARAEVLRAAIAKNAADQASKRKDIAADQDKASTALTGNSAAAIGNRQQLLGNIQNSQQYIQQLAANGATPPQIQAAIAAQKKQFIEQATQAGFSRKEVVKLAAAYDDMNQVVKTIPRNITTHIDSNASPAKKAVEEYLATLKATDGTRVKTAIDTTITYTTNPQTQLPSQVGTPVYNYPDYLKNPSGSSGAPASIAAPTLPKFLTDPASVYPKQWASWIQTFRGGSKEKAPNGDNEVATWIRLLKANGIKLPKGYRGGGYTGSLPPWQAAGLVHGDEFVLNSRGYRMFPRAMLEGANAGVAPVIPKVTATATLGPGATVGLSPQAERALISGASGGTLTVRGDRIGSALDGAFVNADRRGSA